MMEKRGIIDENTPAEKECCGGGCHAKAGKQPTTKKAADDQEAHVATRLSDAAADACRKDTK